jgi:hypothetical protein
MQGFCSEPGPCPTKRLLGEGKTSTKIGIGRVGPVGLVGLVRPVALSDDWIGLADDFFCARVELQESFALIAAQGDRKWACRGFNSDKHLVAFQPNESYGVGVYQVVPN